MKKIIATAMAGLFAASMAYGVVLTEGTKELQLNGMIDLDSSAGTAIDFGIGYGVFIQDNVEVGARASIADNDLQTSWNIGAFGEYNVDTGAEYVPYVGVAIDYADTELDVADVTAGDGALQVAGLLGIKYFLTENLAVDVNFEFDWATEDIYFNDLEAEDTDMLFNLGLRYYFQ